MCNAENDRDKEKQYLDQLMNRRVDGLVLISSVLEKEDFERINEVQLPVVMVGGCKCNPGFSCVRIDCRAAAREATEHLTDIGYKKIAMFCSCRDNHDNREKIEGYREALAEAGIKFNKDYLKRIEDSIEGGYLAAKKIVGGRNRPEAIFTSSDNMAFGVMDAIRDQGRPFQKMLP